MKMWHDNTEYLRVKTQGVIDEFFNSLSVLLLEYECVGKRVENVL